MWPIACWNFWVLLLYTSPLPSCRSRRLLVCGRGCEEARVHIYKHWPWFIPCSFGHKKCQFCLKKRIHFHSLLDSGDPDWCFSWLSASPFTLVGAQRSRDCRCSDKCLALKNLQLLKKERPRFHNWRKSKDPALGTCECCMQQFSFWK